MEATQQQISVAEIATAIGTENLVLRLVQLQRQITELEAALAAVQSGIDSPPPAFGPRVVVPKESVTNGR